MGKRDRPGEVPAHRGGPSSSTSSWEPWAHHVAVLNLQFFTSRMGTTSSPRVSFQQGSDIGTREQSGDSEAWHTFIFKF